MSQTLADQGLWMYRYKYRSEDGRHYILAFHEIGYDGISRAKWSRYSYTGDPEEEEQEHITVSEEFQPRISKFDQNEHEFTFL